MFYFGNIILPKAQVFYQTSKSFAFVNLKPILNGRKNQINIINLNTKILKDVLISPNRRVKRFSELDPEEVSDLWITAQKVGTVLEKVYNSSSLTFVIQDGPEAGQTISHVHIHVVPRKKMDFENNDQIYDELNKVDNVEREPRSMEDMKQEADVLRTYFE